MPIDIINQANQPPKIEDEPVDLDAIEPQQKKWVLRKIPPQWERIIHEIYIRSWVEPGTWSPRSRQGELDNLRQCA